MGYKSANQTADVGDEIQKYIQEIASVAVASNKKTAEWAANVSKEVKAKDDQLKSNDGPNPSPHQHRCNAINSNCSGSKKEQNP